MGVWKGPESFYSLFGCVVLYSSTRPLLFQISWSGTGKAGLDWQGRTDFCSLLRSHPRNIFPGTYAAHIANLARPFRNEHGWVSTLRDTQYAARVISTSWRLIVSNIQCCFCCFLLFLHSGSRVIYTVDAHCRLRGIPGYYLSLLRFIELWHRIVGLCVSSCDCVSSSDHCLNVFNTLYWL